MSLICQTWSFQTFTLDFDPTKPGSLDALQHKVSAKIRDLPPSVFRLVQQGKQVTDVHKLEPEHTLFIELHGSLKGGKGGFGSLLRSMKPKAKGDENFEACRDLSGRRLRHINNESRLREW